MGRFAKGSQEAKDWAKKMREAKMSKGVAGGSIAPMEEEVEIRLKKPPSKHKTLGKGMPPSRLPESSPAAEMVGRVEGMGMGSRLLSMPIDMFREIVSSLGKEDTLSMLKYAKRSDEHTRILEEHLASFPPPLPITNAPKSTQRKRIAPRGRGMCGGEMCIECDKCAGMGLLSAPVMDDAMEIAPLSMPLDKMDWGFNYIEGGSVREGRREFMRMRRRVMDDLETLERMILAEMVDVEGARRILGNIVAIIDSAYRAIPTSAYSESERLAIEEQVNMIEQMLPPSPKMPEMPDTARGAGISKALKKAGKKITKGVQSAAKATKYVNPMMWAIENKGTRGAMTTSGDIAYNYALPAVVEAGKPVLDTAAMSASTALTGNPLLGKMVVDTLWKEMVEKKGVDPRQRQKSSALGAISNVAGQVAAARMGSELGMKAGQQVAAKAVAGKGSGASKVQPTGKPRTSYPKIKKNGSLPAGLNAKEIEAFNSIYSQLGDATLEEVMEDLKAEAKRLADGLAGHPYDVGMNLALQKRLMELKR